MIASNCLLNILLCSWTSTVRCIPLHDHPHVDLKLFASRRQHQHDVRKELVGYGNAVTGMSFCHSHPLPVFILIPEASLPGFKSKPVSSKRPSKVPSRDSFNFGFPLPNVQYILPFEVRNLGLGLECSTGNSAVDRYRLSDVVVRHGIGDGYASSLALSLSLPV